MSARSQLPVRPERFEKPPPLEAGDHLTRAEFERRYDAMPDLHKAELVEGIVYMPSPLRWNRHSRPHGCLLHWMGHYGVCIPGVDGGGNGSIRMDDTNELQPDGILIIRPECGGQARITDDDYLEGSPELVGEVSTSTVSFDLGTKLKVYQRNGVKEYVVWRVVEEAIDWFILRDGKYVNLPLHVDGYIESEIFPGLRLEPAAMVQFDMATVLRVLQCGIDSPAHAAFVARLQAK